MAAVPTPLDPAPGDKNSASAFDAGVRDVLNFLLDPPRCEVSLSSATVALANNTATLISFDSETSDTDNMHSVSVNTSRITANTPGRYLFTISVIVDAVAYTRYDVNARINAGGVAGGGSSIRTWAFANTAGTAPPRQITATFSRYLNTNDYVEFFVTVSPAGNLTGGAGVNATGAQVLWYSIS